eukprot:TRINITY_DN81617_c0_g1_i1.p1 TRINITY_DN81617_c0_g1~~TRINITY_DN81617_c0_g1_i1.p1  ORF type:complete len:178 (-),score=60.27 TRINITY_DN81617_c0_g1_i1:123-656(-)
MEDIAVVAGVCILSLDGRRIYSKYYHPSLKGSLSAQEQLEKNVSDKKRRSTSRTEAEIMILDSWTVVYRTENDIAIFVIGMNEDDALLISAALDALHDALVGLFVEFVDKKTLLEQYEAVVVAVDEVIDNGVILEVDDASICSRVVLKSEESDSEPVESFSQAFKQAKEQIKRSFFR